MADTNDETKENERNLRDLKPLRPKDARVLRVSCEESGSGVFRVHLSEGDWERIVAGYERLFQDRFDLLTVQTKEGMLASEWVMRTAQAERERDELRNEVARLRWGEEMACENTPNPACECPGCETARERATRGESGP